MASLSAHRLAVSTVASTVLMMAALKVALSAVLMADYLVVKKVGYSAEMMGNFEASTMVAWTASQLVEMMEAIEASMLAKSKADVRVECLDAYSAN